MAQVTVKELIAFPCALSVTWLCLAIDRFMGLVNPRAMFINRGSALPQQKLWKLARLYRRVAPEYTSNSQVILCRLIGNQWKHHKLNTTFAEADTFKSGYRTPEGRNKLSENNPPSLYETSPVHIHNKPKSFYC
ncbi:6407_t:CDS:2 [Ambispora leptoticha]|uniref:6407_t:CDS:1 n=1 Tax=Ambispora leptoticha TaxID=144679 RepID=A0A9N8YWA4_9GLOM|nr:6407_t:CDS:2 [Ambispora leptoticha]